MFQKCFGGNSIGEGAAKSIDKKFVREEDLSETKYARTPRRDRYEVGD